MIHRTAAMLLIAAAACLGPPACSKPPPEPAPESRGRVDTYTVRGVVTALPDPAKPGSALAVHHEAIDDFRHVDTGEAVGMGSMHMDFEVLAPGVSLAELVVGDKIEMTFTVRGKPDYTYTVTAIRKLPSETQLEFRAARPTG